MMGNYGMLLVLQRLPVSQQLDVVYSYSVIDAVSVVLMVSHNMGVLSASRCRIPTHTSTIKHW